MKETVAAWESEARSLVRFFLGFMFFLHGVRFVYGLMPIANARGLPRLALDSLPPMVGYFELGAGVLLMLGLFARPVAFLAALQSAAAYAVYTHGFWTLRNGGEEAMIYFMMFLYIAAAGAGAWSLDSLLHREKGPRPSGEDGTPGAAT
jgi:putative oxidoreductase